MSRREGLNPEHIDLDEVVRLVKEAGFPAFVQQTGGGTATIYAGESTPDEDYGEIYEAAAGPGWFDGPDWTLGTALKGDLYVGPDGETDDYVSITDHDTEADVAFFLIHTIQTVRRLREGGTK